MFAPTPLCSLDEIARRLPVIFPEGTPQRGELTRDATARTVFVMLYMDAVAGRGPLLAPRSVVRMSDGQAAMQDDAERAAFIAATAGSGYIRERPPEGFHPPLWAFESHAESHVSVAQRETSLESHAESHVSASSDATTLPHWSYSALD